MSSFELKYAEFARRPTALLQLLQTGKIPFESVRVCSEKMIRSQSSRAWIDFASCWEYETYREGKRGSISFRVRRGDRIETVYAGQYVIVLTEPLFEYKIGSPMVGGATQETAIRRMLESFEDLHANLSGIAWPYFIDDGSVAEYGVTFSNHEDAVIFAAMNAANQN